MALINCPECGKEISDKAEVCIYCGYPIGKYSKKEFSHECPICKNDNWVENNLKGSMTCQICGYDFIIDKQKYKIYRQQENQPKCPICQSTNIRKINSGERVGSAIGLGLFSRKVHKTFKCNNCGYMW